MPETLTEHVADWQASADVDRTRRTIRNVALAGAESKNGYRYAEAALRAAAPLYEGVPVFLDHPTSPTRPRQRSARDLAGSVTAARFENGRLRGDLRTHDTDAGRTLLALAEAATPNVGMSHVVLAQRSADGLLVEAIAEVISVDAVVFPATTRTFRESRDSHEPSEPHPAETNSAETNPAKTNSAAERDAGPSLEALLARLDAELPGHLRRLAVKPAGRGVRVGVHPGFVLLEWRDVGTKPQRFALPWRLEGSTLTLGTALQPAETLTADRSDWGALSQHCEHKGDATTHDVRLETLAETLRQTAAERDRLADQLAQLTAEQTTAATVTRLLEQADLPAEAITPAFRRHLETTAAPARAALIADRRRLVERLTARVPSSIARHSTGTAGDAQFLTALKGR